MSDPTRAQQIEEAARSLLIEMGHPSPRETRLDKLAWKLADALGLPPEEPASAPAASQAPGFETLVDAFGDARSWNAGEGTQQWHEEQSARAALLAYVRGIEEERDRAQRGVRTRGNALTLTAEARDRYAKEADEAKREIAFLTAQLASERVALAAARAHLDRVKNAIVDAGAVPLPSESARYGVAVRNSLAAVVKRAERAEAEIERLRRK